MGGLDSKIVQDSNFSSLHQSVSVCLLVIIKPRLEARDASWIVKKKHEKEDLVMSVS